MNEGNPIKPIQSVPEDNVLEGVTEYLMKKPNEVQVGDRLNLYGGEAVVTGVTDNGGLTIRVERNEDGKVVPDALQFDSDEKYTDDVEVVVS